MMVMAHKSVNRLSIVLNNFPYGSALCFPCPVFAVSGSALCARCHLRSWQEGATGKASWDEKREGQGSLKT